MAKDNIVEHAYAVILAGGSGTRFWPLSRRRHPKQLLELYGRGSLLEQTVARIRPLIPPRRTFVLTSEIVRGEICRRLSMVPRRQIIGEPAGRNTAPTIGLAAYEILRKDCEGLMVVLPSDHIILRAGEFRRALRTACRVAWEGSKSVVLGLKPTRPETGYGYVRVGTLESRLGRRKVFRVEKFTEKPPLDLARRFLASGRYLWNGGMFIWRASTLIENLKRNRPRMASILERIAAAGGARSARAMRRLFPKLENISIDYALMEKISEVSAVAVDIGWSDVGSWTVAYELNRKDRDSNVRPRNSVCVDSRRNLIVSPRKFVLTVGTRDLVIVETDDALLVCNRDRSQDLGEAVRGLEKRGLTKFL